MSKSEDFFSEDGLVLRKFLKDFAQSHRSYQGDISSSVMSQLGLFESMRGQKFTRHIAFNLLEQMSEQLQEIREKLKEAYCASDARK